MIAIRYCLLQGATIFINVNLLLAVLVTDPLPFRDPSRSLDDRVDDLVGRLALDEMMKQMALGGHQPWAPAPAIPRLGIQPFVWNGECEHGANGVPNATAFPQAIGLAASFSAGFMTAVSMEYRAYYNHMAAHNTSLWASTATALPSTS